MMTGSKHDSTGSRSDMFEKFKVASSAFIPQVNAEELLQQSQNEEAKFQKRLENEKLKKRMLDYRNEREKLFIVVAENSQKLENILSDMNMFDEDGLLKNE